jgi:hypothetical protein
MGDIGCWCLTMTMGDGVGRCQQWAMTTQQATECGNCKKAATGHGDGCGNANNSKEEVVDEDGGDSNGDGNGNDNKRQNYKDGDEDNAKRIQWALLDATINSQCVMRGIVLNRDDNK